MDILSQILSVIRVEAATFYRAEFYAPWSQPSLPMRSRAPHPSRNEEHLVVFHLLTEGRGWARLADGDPLSLDPGDVVIVPHGDAHVLENRALTGGETTRLVCGYLSCEPRLVRILLCGLPPLFKVNIRGATAGSWLESSIRFAVDQAGASRAGSEAVLAKLSEALFVETLRRYITLLPEGQTGWLAGARDPEVGRVLSLMHRHPARPWTVNALAKAAGLSRSVLTERFSHYLGEPPIAYLTRWRLRRAAQLLRSSRDGLAQVAFEVGYESEPAFNRAFKREFGLPPGRFRDQSISDRRLGREIRTVR
jgi:AraC-like DNA-binding protein